MKKIIQLVDRLLQRYMPDPFVIAILLTVITFVLACFFNGQQPGLQASESFRPEEIIRYWGNGFWNLAEFTLQMAMILIGGFVVATSRPVKAILRLLVSTVNSPFQAVLFCTLAAIVASWINWGFGLVVGAIVALEVGRRLPQVSFRVLVASSYSGFLVWHAGLSGSIPLVLNTKGRVSTDLTGELIPLSETTFSSFNLIALGSMVLLLPVINLLNLSIAHDEPAHFTEIPEPEQPAGPISDVWINRSFLPVALLVGLAGYFWYVNVDSMVVGGEDVSFYSLSKSLLNSLNLNSVIFVFFMAGLLLQGTPNAFIKSVTEATPKIAPILIQYPLYAGIMAILSDSGMAEQISQWFVENSTKTTFPLMTFYSAGLLNLLVPSGGGQWAVQAPIVVPAAQELGVGVPRAAMAVAWGDAWTNMAQPFWAIPLLTIAGLNIKDIMGFCLITLFASGAVLSLIFLVC